MKAQVITIIIGSILAIIFAYIQGYRRGKKHGNDLVKEADRLAKVTIKKERDRDDKNDATIDDVFSKLP